MHLCNTKTLPNFWIYYCILHTHWDTEQYWNWKYAYTIVNLIIYQNSWSVLKDIGYPLSHSPSMYVCTLLYIHNKIIKKTIFDMKYLLIWKK